MSVLFLSLLPHSPRRQLAGQTVPVGEKSEEEEKRPRLTVMTWNIAHGRGDGLHQALRSKRTIQSNLDRIGDAIREIHPSIVALQEADGPSLWSGRFDHVSYLAEKTALPYRFHGEHFERCKVSFGTALLSRLPLRDTTSVSLESLFSLTKGFVVATVRWPGRPRREIDVVSLHLDFLLKKTRRRQVRQLAETLEKRDRPTIVLGDFNCDFDGEESTLRDFARRLDLRAHRPKAPDIVTFNRAGRGRRLDWILVSPELRFAGHRVLGKGLSDHSAVVVEFELLEEAEGASPRRGATRSRPGLEGFDGSRSDWRFET